METDGDEMSEIIEVVSPCLSPSMLTSHSGPNTMKISFWKYTKTIRHPKNLNFTQLLVPVHFVEASDWMMSG